jgi:hypothetical protein
MAFLHEHSFQTLNCADAQKGNRWPKLGLELLEFVLRKLYAHFEHRFNPFLVIRSLFFFWSGDPDLKLLHFAFFLEGGLF